MEITAAFKKAVKAAGEASLDAQPSTRITVNKGDGDFATQADLDCGRIMENILQEQLPEFPIVAEENKTGHSDQEFFAERQQILNSGTFILMDDLDATIAFKAGDMHYGHMVGLVQNNELTNAALYLPRRNILITAEKGKGCFINDIRIRLDQTKRSTNSLLCLVIHQNIPRTFHDRVSNIIYEEHPAGYACLNSNIGGIARVCESVYGGFLGAGHSWDFVGALCLTEAGGVALSANGNPLNWQQIPMIFVGAANQHIAEAILKHTHDYDFAAEFWDNKKFTR